MLRNRQGGSKKQLGKERPIVLLGSIRYDLVVCRWVDEREAAEGLVSRHVSAGYYCYWLEAMMPWLTFIGFATSSSFRPKDERRLFLFSFNVS